MEVIQVYSRKTLLPKTADLNLATPPWAKETRVELYSGKAGRHLILQVRRSTSGGLRFSTLTDVLPTRNRELVHGHRCWLPKR
jgi:hypothetical protein